ncbi:MYND-type domain-containing protein [Mycena chlorophos]|uniref:MYND-type domain-containing protein n=1 Tax=Mycena chlorophos TaxID=658473 RepID=A0A8H6TGY0_MYCCL|nr:MYND-type domain-containing protein [Mycena chlorophos]
MELPRDLWPPYTTWPTPRFPRNIDSLETPWVASPEPNSKREWHSAQGTEAPATAISSSRPSKGLSWLASRLRKRQVPGESVRVDGQTGIQQRESSRSILVQLPENEQFPSTKAMVEKPSDTDWRAFASYSRPCINGVDVHNTFTDSPTPYRELDPEDVNVEEIFDSLWSPGGNPHPERWIRGIKHPSLPPEPTWHVPTLGEPLPFPWELHLNPFLQAALTGPAPVYWNIRQGPGPADGGVLHGGPIDSAAFPLSAQDMAQPATFPLVTHMYVSGLGLAAARLPWKFFVVNHTGVKVRDVFNAVAANFRELVFEREVRTWDRERLAHARLEFRLRGGHLRDEEGLRRMDYLNGQLFFRGLAPNPDLTGWLLFVGPRW